jgi:hypothetical protein
MMQKLICISILVLLSNAILKAQNCLSDFMQEVTQCYVTKNETFTKEANRLIPSISDNQKKIINVPVIYSTKKAVKISRKVRINKDNFFCYLDASSMSFDESIIITDTVVGIVIPSADPSQKLEYINVEDDYHKTVAEEIRRINPEVIFTIYNIPRCYWYFKDNEMNVLANPNNGFKAYKATDYWKDYLTEEQISFLYHKKVVVISGK